MSHLRSALADYLTMRRALGYKMDQVERRLRQFVAFAEERGETHVRTVTALAWATLPSGADPVWTNRRLADVRIFARHLHTLDGVSEVPPDDLIPARRRRTTPYLFTPQEVADLMRATEILPGSHVQATYRVLIGLLAVTGMRIGEAIGLDSDDLNIGDGIVTIRKGKFDKARALPLHPTTVAVLQKLPSSIRSSASFQRAGSLDQCNWKAAALQHRAAYFPEAAALLRHRSAFADLPTPDSRSTAQLRRQHHRRRISNGCTRLPLGHSGHLPWSCRPQAHVLVLVGSTRVAGLGRR